MQSSVLRLGDRLLSDCICSKCPSILLDEYEKLAILPASVENRATGSDELRVLYVY